MGRLNDRKSVLITGVAGLLGSRFADYVTREHPDYMIIGVDNMSGGYYSNLPKGWDDPRNERFVFSKIDVESDALKNLFDIYEPEYVFHFAAYAAEGLSPFIRKFNYRNNMLSTANVINNCITHDVRRLVYTSSMSVYGEGVAGERFDETLQPHPKDPYAISKYACELDIACAKELHGLDWCIIRPHNVYGVNQNIWDMYRNVLGIWMWQKLNGLPFTIYGSGEQTRAFSYIDDCLPCIWNAATYDKASCEIVNLGGVRPYSINQACEVLAGVVGGGDIVHKEQRYEVKHAVPSFQKSIDVLDYDETITLETGLGEMWEWAKRQPKRERVKWESYEVGTGIYSYWK